MTDNALAERQELISAVRSFGQKQLAPGALDRAHDPHYNWEIAQQFGEMGLLGLTIPRATR
jgi:alkylation response protein AidB-like acyl-CoA dehydrogenase